MIYGKSFAGIDVKDFQNIKELSEQEMDTRTSNVDIGYIIK